MTQWNQYQQPERPQYREPVYQQTGYNQQPYQAGYGQPPLVQTRGAASVFSRTMGLVAATTGFFTVGAVLGRDLPPATGLMAYMGAFILMLVMQFTRRASTTTATVMLFGFGALMGVASAPTLAYYAAFEPNLLVRAAAATTLFMVGLGAAGYGIRRDLSAVARISSWALLGLILFGIVAIFLPIPGASLIYCVLGLAIFAGLTLVDFQRLRQTDSMASAPYLAVSIFLDALNVFWFFLRLFGGGRRD